VVRGVPLITVLFMASVMFALFMPENLRIDQLLRAQVAIILFVAAYLAEAVRGGLQAVPKGQYEAAQALGLPYWRTMGFIVLPQALKISIPPIVNSFISLFKDTSLVVVIAIYDFAYAVKKSTETDYAWKKYFIEAFLLPGVLDLLLRDVQIQPVARARPLPKRTTLIDPPDCTKDLHDVTALPTHPWRTGHPDQWTEQVVR
jgi:general L-amino acid transport system permease protein